MSRARQREADLPSYCQYVRLFFQSFLSAFYLFFLSFLNIEDKKHNVISNQSLIIWLLNLRSGL